MTVDTSPEQLPWRMVVEPDDLAELCTDLRAAGRFGIDMEFSRERTYYATLELVQVASPDQLAIVDPLRIEDLSPLFDLVADPDVECVFHAGSQDLEIMYQAAEREPRRVFDTQIAAALVGFGDQTRYDILVRKMLNRKLSKHQSTTDWAKRPLSEEQVAYALDDVRYLLPLRDALAERLDKEGRSGWVAEEMQHLEQAATYIKDPESLLRGIKGFGKLDGEQLAILRELAVWRTELAQRRNQPIRWVVPDDVLLAIARRKPSKIEQLTELRRLSQKVAEREGAEILERVKRARSLPSDDRPQVRAFEAEDRVIDAVVELLDVWVRQRAHDTGVAASYLGTRKHITELVRAVRAGTHESDPPELLRGWRRELVGDELVDLAEGRTGIAVDPSTGRVHPVAHPGEARGGA